MVYDALEMSYRKIKVRKDPDCVLCGENPTVTDLLEDYEDFCGAVSPEAEEATLNATITARELKDWQDSGKDLFLVPSGARILHRPSPAPPSSPRGYHLGDALSRFRGPAISDCKSSCARPKRSPLQGRLFRYAVPWQGGCLLDQAGRSLLPSYEEPALAGAANDSACGIGSRRSVSACSTWRRDRFVWHTVMRLEPSGSPGCAAVRSLSELFAWPRWSDGDGGGRVPRRQVASVTPPSVSRS